MVKNNSMNVSKVGMKISGMLLLSFFAILAVSQIDMKVNDGFTKILTIQDESIKLKRIYTDSEIKELLILLKS